MSNRLKRSLSFILGGLLALDGLYLISQNKVHLGIILPVIIGMGLIFYALAFDWIQSCIQVNKFRQKIWFGLWTAFFLWLSSVLIFFIYISSTLNHHLIAPPSTAVIVLGSGIENGQPSLTLKHRLDVSAAYAKQYPQTLLIMTGGLGFQQNISEAEVMSQYLQKQHQIDQSRILLEDKSTSTEQNLKNSQSLLAANQIALREPIAIATSDFHILRAKAIAKRQGYQQIIGLSATTPLYIRYNSWLREYFAFISGWMLNEY